MITSWMLYSILVTFLLGLGAAASERALRLGGRAGRWVWLAAVAGAVVVPGAGLVFAGSGGTPGSVSLGPVAPVAAPVATAWGSVVEGWEVGAVSRLGGLDAPLLGLWSAASALLLALLVMANARLSRSRGRWTERVLDGDPVLVSQDVGPAVLGLLRPRVVVPRWLVERGPESRRLILRHEHEHCRTRDPLVVFLAAVPVILLPWNVGLWWCLARLRLAVELDCDQRVLRGATAGARRRYGELLLDVGSRPAGLFPALAAFPERRSDLERRLRALTERLPDHRLRRVVASGLLGVVGVVAACTVPSPDASRSALEPDPSADSGAGELPATAEGAQAVEGGPHFTPFTDPPVLRNEREFRATLDAAYPETLRAAGIGGVVDVWIYIDETGDVRRAAVNESSGHRRLDEVAVRVATIMRFSPALSRDEVVPVWVSVPIRFGADPAARATAEARGEEPRVLELPPPPEERASLGDEPVFTPYTVPPALRNRAQVRDLLREAYPPLLRDAGVAGSAEIWLFIDEEGRVQQVRVNRSSGFQALDEAALGIARAMEFTPARNGDRLVPVWVSIPVAFEPS